MRAAIDTWAFREIAEGTARGLDAAAIIAESEAPFTVRDCVVETFNATLHRRGAAAAWAWWGELQDSGIRVFEPPLKDVYSFSQKVDRGDLSLVDLSLAFVATRERTKTILSEDAGFRRVGLQPVFAVR